MGAMSLQEINPTQGEIAFSRIAVEQKHKITPGVLHTAAGGVFVPQQHLIIMLPSVGRFKDDGVASLYVKRSSTGMSIGLPVAAIYSNYGTICEKNTPSRPTNRLAGL